MYFRFIFHLFSPLASQSPGQPPAFYLYILTLSLPLCLCFYFCHCRLFDSRIDFFCNSKINPMQSIVSTKLKSIRIGSLLLLWNTLIDYSPSYVNWSYNRSIRYFPSFIIYHLYHWTSNHRILVTIAHCTLHSTVHTQIKHLISFN